LFRSTDHGANWKQIGHQFPNGKIYDIVVSASGDLYCIAYFEYVDHDKSGLWRSTDNGDNWSHIRYGDNYTTLIASPDSSIHISSYSTTQETYSFRSTDNGVTWDSAFVTNAGYIIKSGTDINGNLFHCGSTNLFRSSNKGKSWSKIVNGLTASEYRSIAFAPNGDIYLCGQGYGKYGFFRSTDGGRTWERQYFTGGIDANLQTCAVSPSGRILFVATYDILYSDDNCSTWHKYGDFKTDRGGFGVPSFVFVASPDSGFYSSTSSCLQYAKAPGAAPWDMIPVPIASVPALISHPDGSILSSSIHTWGNQSTNSNSGLWRSTDGGNTWGQVFDSTSFDYFNPTCFAIDSSMNIIAGSSGRIFRSTNSGLNWKQNKAVLTAGTLTSAIVAPDGTIYTSSSADGVYRSTDNGITWDQLNDGIEKPQISSLAVNASGTVFAGASDALYRSTDNGLTWQSLTIDTVKGVVNCLVVSLQGNVIAGIKGVGIYWSTDNGDSWSELGQGMTTNLVNSLLSTPSGIVFAGTDSGVFKLDVGATTWQAYSIGLTTQKVNALARNAAGKLYAGTDGAGVFGSLNTFNIAPLNARDFALNANNVDFSVTYQTASTAMNANFTILHPGSVTIECLDVVGRTVQKHTQSCPSGKNTIEIPMSSLSEGMYFFRITVGSTMGKVIPVIHIK
ncbi:MAG TPA: YCF48-related protein, partial [Candidatus Kapabacteria bacterium]